MYITISFLSFFSRGCPFRTVHNGILNELTSLCNDLRGTAVVTAIPEALEVTRFGWAQRKIKQSAVSPRLSPRMGGRVLSTSLDEVGATTKKT